MRHQSRATAHQPRWTRHADAHLAVVTHVEAVVNGCLEDAFPVADLQRVGAALMSDLHLNEKCCIKMLEHSQPCWQGRLHKQKAQGCPIASCQPKPDTGLSTGAKAVANSRLTVLLEAPATGQVAFKT